jgi:hypothetical protein
MENMLGIKYSPTVYIKKGFCILDRLVEIWGFLTLWRKKVVDGFQTSF